MRVFPCRFLPVILLPIFPLLLSCVGGRVDTPLDEAESLMAQRPDSALVVLESMDTSSIRTRSDKAKYSLLYSMALDKNYIDTTDTRVIMPAVKYYKRHGTQDDRMKALYYLGVAQFNGKHYQDAVISFFEAVNCSSDSQDLVFRGLIFSAISDTYSEDYNYAEDVRYANKAYDCFHQAGDSTRMWITEGRLAALYDDNQKWAEADSLYSQFLSTPVRDSSVFADNAFLAAKHYVLRPGPLPERSRELFRQSVYEMGGAPSLVDYCVYAYACELCGDTKEADGIVSQVKAVDDISGPVEIWLYYIDKHRGNSKAALKHFENTIAAQDSIVVSSLKQSVSKARSEYYQTKADLLKKDNEARGQWIMTASIVFLFILFAMLELYLRGRRQWLRRTEEMTAINDVVSCQVSLLSEKSTEMERKIEERDKSLSHLQKAYVALHKDRYSMLSDLCSAYWRPDGSQSQRQLLEKTKETLSLFEGDNQNELEAMINDYDDGIISKLRSDIPALGETDIRFICYFILGFDAKTVACMTGYAVSSVYTKKNRIGNTILKSSSTFKEEYFKRIF